MSLTKKQLELRKTTVGSSEAHKLLDLGYGTPYDLWLEKTGRVDHSNDELNMNFILGHALEPIVLESAEKRLGKLKRNQRRVCKDHRFAANVDAIVVDTGEPVEAKTSGIRNSAYIVDGWGEPMSGEIPAGYAVQCHIHMLCTGTKVCHVEALLGDGRFFVPYIIDRNQELIDVLCQKCDDFWECVERDIPPEMTTPTIDVLKNVRREYGKVVHGIPDKLYHAYKNCHEKVKYWTEEKERCRDQILAALFDAKTNTFADAGVFQNGAAVTYSESSPSKAIDTARLRKERPDVAKEYEKGTKSRRFNIKDGGIK